MKLRPLIKKSRIDKFRKNKRGAIGLIIFFAVLIIALLLGFGAAIVISIIDIASDELTPIMTDLGVIQQGNISINSIYASPSSNISNTDRPLCFL